MGNQYEEELVREMARRGYSRRQVLRYGLGLGLSATALSSLLAACGAERRPQTSAGQSAAKGTPQAGAQPTSAPQPTAKAQFSETEGSSGKWPKTAVDEPGSKVELSVAHAWDASFWPRQQQFDRQFMKRHPNISIKAENTPWEDFLQKYVAQGAGGTLPDLMYIHFSWAQQLIQQRVLSELDDYVDRQDDFDIDDFTKPSLVSYRHDGKLYGIPYDEGPGILFYNKDLFDKAKVDYPTEKWTLGDLKEAAIKLTSGEGRRRVYGFAGTPTPGDGAMAPSYLFPFGAQYISEPKEDKCLIDSPEAVEAMEWWMELRSKYKAVPSPADVETMQGDPFQFGRVAMMLNGSWATPPLNQNAKFKWDVAVWPKGPKKHSTFSAGSCYAITKNSKHADAAWIYLNEYISPAGETFMWGSTGRGSPSRNSAWKSYLDSKFSPPNAKIIQESLNTIASHDILDKPTAPEVSQKAGSIWDRVVTGKLSVKQALDQVCRDIGPILAKNDQ